MSSTHQPPHQPCQHEWLRLELNPGQKSIAPINIMIFLVTPMPSLAYEANLLQDGLLAVGAPCESPNCAEAETISVLLRITTTAKEACMNGWGWQGLGGAGRTLSRWMKARLHTYTAVQRARFTCLPPVSLFLLQNPPSISNMVSGEVFIKRRQMKSNGYCALHQKDFSN